MVRLAWLALMLALAAACNWGGQEGEDLDPTDSDVGIDTEAPGDSDDTDVADTEADTDWNVDTGSPVDTDETDVVVDTGSVDTDVVDTEVGDTDDTDVPIDSDDTDVPTDSAVYDTADTGSFIDTAVHGDTDTAVPTDTAADTADSDDGVTRLDTGLQRVEDRPSPPGSPRQGGAIRAARSGVP